MPFGGGHMSFGDDSDKKPKKALQGMMPSYNNATRKRRGKKHKHAMGKAHGMRAGGFNRVKGS